jgi:predicted small lipoprotein YifL
MVALALAGCGRKGPLDLPPTASAPTASVAPGDTQASAAKPSLFDPSYGTNAAPAAPRGRKQPFVLDPLLGN